VALEKLDGISAAYVNNDIHLHLTDKDGYDQKEVTKTLKAFKMVIKKESSTEESPFTKPEAKTKAKG